MIKLKTFVFSPFSENTFVVWDENAKDAMIVDPGCLETFEEYELESFISSQGLNVKFLINTHCHIDHIFGNKFIMDKYNPRFYTGKEDVFLLEKAIEQADLFGVSLKPSPDPDHTLSEDLVLALGNSDAKFIFTPGHTPGEFCIYFEEAKICITGDVLFRLGIGRTDLWGGNYDVLINSIQTKLFTLPEDVTIYPGHGPTSTIGFEKRNNGFVKG